MRLVKIAGLGIAAALLAVWIGGPTASAKPAYKTATGQDCMVCHSEKPYKKDKLTAKGNKFDACLKSGKTADQCKGTVS
jgi:hypothetical protein